MRSLIVDVNSYACTTVLLTSGAKKRSSRYHSCRENRYEHDSASTVFYIHLHPYFLDVSLFEFAYLSEHFNVA